MSGGWISASQFERDLNGQRNICAACGHDGSEANPLVVEDGSRIHTSHTTNRNSGYYQPAQDRNPVHDHAAWMKERALVAENTDADTDEM